MALTYTVAQVIAVVQARFPSGTNQRITELINLVHRDIIAMFPELTRTTLTQNVIASQGEYALTESSYHVESVYWQTAAATEARLLHTSVEKLDSRYSTWRTDAAATPNFFYLSANQSGAGSTNQAVVGLYPVPLASTVAGYPQLIFNVTQIEASALTSTSTLPVTMNSQMIYIEGASSLLSKEINPGLVEAYEVEYTTRKQELAAYLKQRTNMYANTGV